MTELNAKATLDLQNWRAGIQQIKADIQALSNAKGSSTSVKILVSDGGTTQRTRKEVDELSLATKRLANEAATIRNRFQAGFGQATQSEVEAFRAQMEEVRERALKMADGLELGDDRLRKLTQTARLATASIEAAEGNISRLGLASQTAAGIMSTGIIDALQQFGPVGQIISGFIEIFFSNAEKAVQGESKKTEQAAKKAGQQTGEGFADGLENTTDVRRAAHEMGTTATDSLKAALDIHSPSRVAYQIGGQVGTGFEQGIRASRQRVAQAAKDLANQVPSNMSSSVSLGTVDLGMKSAIPTVQALGNELVDLKRQALEASQAFNNIPTGIQGINEQLADFFGGASEQSASLEVAVHGASQAVETTAEVVGAGAEVIDTATESVERVTSATNVWMASLTALGIIVTGLTVNGIRQLGGFEKAMNTFNASGETNIAGLEEEITKLQQSTTRAAKSFSKAELAGALAETIKAGTTSSEAMTVLNTSTQLAAAESDNLTESSGRLLKNLRQFDAGVDQAARFGNALAKAGSEAAGDVKGLSEGLATVGVAAKTAGFDLEDVLGVLVELDKKGLDAAQEGATGFRTVLSALADPSEEAREAIQGLGIDIEDMNGLARPTKDIMYDLVDALKGNAQAGNYAFKIFGNEGATAFLGISEASRKMAKDFRDSEGALREFSDKMTEGTVKAAERFKKALDDVSLGFVKTFTPAATATLEGLLALGKGFEQAANDGTLAVVAITGVSVALTKLNTTLLYSPARVILSTMFTSATTAASGLIATMRTFALLNPAGLVIAGFGTLVAILTKVNNLYKELADLQDQINAQERQSAETLMRTVKNLREQGTEIGKLQAQRLLLMDRLNAQTPDGADVFGNVKYKPLVDGEARVKLMKDLKDLNKAIEAEQKKTNATVKQTVQNTIKFTAEQLDALGKIDDLKLDLLSPLDREIATIKNRVDDVISELKDTIKNQGVLEIKIKEVREIESDLISRARADAAKDAEEKARAEREKAQREREAELRDLESANRQAGEINRAARDAEIAAITDDNRRKQAERAAELSDLKRSLAEALEAVAGYPAQRRQIEQDGQRQIAALRQQWAEEDKKAEEEAVQKRLEARRREQEQLRLLQDAQSAGITQGLEARLNALGQAQDRERQAAGENSEALLDIEKRFARERTRLQLALLKQQESDRLRDLKRQQSDALSVEGLTATERINIVRRFLQETLNVEQSFAGQRQKIVSDGVLAILKAEADAEAARTRQADEQKKERERLAEEEARNRREAAKNIADAEKEARDSEIAAISDPALQRQKKRDADLEDLQASIQEQIDAVAAYPDAVIRIQAAGQRQITALRKQWANEDLALQQEQNEKKTDEEKRAADERAQAEKQAQDAVLDQRKATVDAQIAAIVDDTKRLDAQRKKELGELKADIAAKIALAKGFPDQQREIETLGQQQIAALRAKWANDDLEALKQANKEKADQIERSQEEQAQALEQATDVVDQAEKAARDSEISSIADETARRQAERDADLADLRESIRERVEAVKAYPEQVKKVEAAGNREIAALRQSWANEDLRIQQDANEKKREEDERRLKEEQALNDKRIEEEKRTREELQRLAREVEGGNTDRLRDVQSNLLDQRLTALQDYYEFAGELAQSNWRLQLDIEQRGIKAINAVRLENLRAAREIELAGLRQSLAEQLQDTRLTEVQRASIRQSFAAVLAQTDERYALERLSIERGLITSLNALDRRRTDAQKENLQTQIDRLQSLKDAARELDQTLKGDRIDPVSLEDVNALVTARARAITAAQEAVKSGDPTKQAKAFAELNAVLQRTADLQKKVSGPQDELKDLLAQKAQVQKDIRSAIESGDREAEQKARAEYRDIQTNIQQTTQLINEQAAAQQALDGLGTAGRDLRLQNAELEKLQANLKGIATQAESTALSLADQLEQQAGERLPEQFGALGTSAGEQFVTKFLEHLNSNLIVPGLNVPAIGPTIPTTAPSSAAVAQAMSVTNITIAEQNLNFPTAQISNPDELARMLLPALQRAAQAEANLKGQK